MILPGFPALIAPIGFGIGSFYEGGYYVGDLTIGGEDFQLILAPDSTKLSTVAWNSVTTTVPGARSETDGQANTNAIMAAYPQNIIAAHCNGLSINGYTDWYWPSKDELVAAGAANASLPSGEDFGGNSAHYYWSSTEMTAPHYPNAYLVNGTGALFGSNTKTNGTSSYFARAMRRVSTIGSPNQDFGGPSTSMTAASLLSGAVIGYVKSGGVLAGSIGGASGGSLASTILTGFVTDAVAYIPGIPSISVILIGDARTAIVGLSGLSVNGTLCAIASAPTYNAGGDYTEILLTPTATFANGVTYTIQLI